MYTEFFVDLEMSYEFMRYYKHTIKFIITRKLLREKSLSILGEINRIICDQINVEDFSVNPNHESWNKIRGFATSFLIEENLNDFKFSAEFEYEKDKEGKILMEKSNTNIEKNKNLRKG